MYLTCAYYIISEHIISSHIKSYHHFISSFHIIISYHIIHIMKLGDLILLQVSFGRKQSGMFQSVELTTTCENVVCARWRSSFLWLSSLCVCIVFTSPKPFSIFFVYEQVFVKSKNNKVLLCLYAAHMSFVQALEVRPRTLTREAVL